MRIIAALLLQLAGAAKAMAADGAALNALGYSQDGRYFAFEQYGVQDGSGFPYWDIFLVDLQSNEWVKGSPWRVLLQDEQAKLSAARDKARAAAAPALTEKTVSEPAQLLAAMPATEVTADRQHLSFDRWYRPMGATSGIPSDFTLRHELGLTQKPLPATGNCLPEDQSFGFILTLKDVQSGTTRILSEDAAIPASRNCPLGYDLAAIYAPAGFQAAGKLVAVIGVYSRGFEGADHRFIAVPFNLGE
jgi:predicted secreted protein